MDNDIKQIFSPFYYRAPATEHMNIKGQVEYYYAQKAEENPNNQPGSWGCKVHTTFGSKTDKLFKIKDFYKNDIMRFFRQIEMPPVEVDADDIWINVYKKGQWQENHHHHGDKDVYFSAVHFLKYNKETHPPLIFNNPQNILMTPNQLGRCTNLSYWDLDHSVDVYEGDIIFFPSYLEHQVNVQETDEDRITISFNVKITPHFEDPTHMEKLTVERLAPGSDAFHDDMMQQFMDQAGIGMIGL
jgi:uncharacterized protein (TIGR02466 family)